MSGFQFPEPDSEMVFQYMLTNEEGEQEVHRMVLDGENAEHLPHILKRFSEFLVNLGFDLDLQVAGDATRRIGPAVKALLEKDAKVCALAMLSVAAIDMVAMNPVGTIGQADTLCPSKPRRHPDLPPPPTGLEGDPPAFRARVVLGGATIRFT